MTALQLHDARMLIPGAFELNAPPHRATRAALVVPVSSSREAGPRAADGAPAHVVAASTRPTTPLRRAAAILGDLALIVGLIYGVAVIPGLAMRGVEAAAALILNTLGRN
jgi:hypothetical protein